MASFIHMIIFTRIITGDVHGEAFNWFYPPKIYKWIFKNCFINSQERSYSWRFLNKDCQHWILLRFRIKNGRPNKMIRIGLSLLSVSLYANTINSRHACSWWMVSLHVMLLNQYLPKQWVSKHLKVSSRKLFLTMQWWLMMEPSASLLLDSMNKKKMNSVSYSQIPISNQIELIRILAFIMLSMIKKGNK